MKKSLIIYCFTVLISGSTQGVAFEIDQAVEKLKEFLRGNLSNLLKKKEALPGLLPGDPDSQASAPKILSRMKETTLT